MGELVFLGRQQQGSLVLSPSDLLKVSLALWTMHFVLW